MEMNRRLYKSTENKMISGVCGGIGEYLKIDPTLVRLAVAALTLLSVGAVLIAYGIAVVIIPTPEQ